MVCPFGKSDKNTVSFCTSQKGHEFLLRREDLDLFIEGVTEYMDCLFIPVSKSYNQHSIWFRKRSSKLAGSPSELTNFTLDVASLLCFC